MHGYGGRFLEKDRDGLWYEMTDDLALGKAKAGKLRTFIRICSVDCSMN